MSEFSDQSLQVAAVLMAEPDSLHWVYNLCNATGLQSGTVHQMVRRWERDGLLRVSPVAGGGKGQGAPRKYYEVTKAGRRTFASAL
jgi:DNA-binding PadR family transcriptional regulator